MAHSAIACGGAWWSGTPVLPLTSNELYLGSFGTLVTSFVKGDM